MEVPMKDKLFPLILTSDLGATRAFYKDKLGCEVVIDVPEYLQVRFAGAGQPELCFMLPKPAFGVELSPFTGQGLIVSVPVEDPDGEHQRLSAKRVPIVAEPADRPWGWRSFLCRDPNGVILDFFREKAQADAANA
jgi:catechol 2,3-dioxygenase-like lactoylglutathione lyase family enzyme